MNNVSFFIVAALLFSFVFHPTNPGKDDGGYSNKEVIETDIDLLKGEFPTEQHTIKFIKP